MELTQIEKENVEDSKIEKEWDEPTFPKQHVSLADCWFLGEDENCRIEGCVRTSDVCGYCEVHYEEVYDINNEAKIEALS